MKVCHDILLSVLPYFLLFYILHIIFKILCLSRIFKNLNVTKIMNIQFNPIHDMSSIFRTPTYPMKDTFFYSYGINMAIPGNYLKNLYIPFGISKLKG